MRTGVDAMNWVCAFIRKIKMKRFYEILEISKVLMQQQLRKRIERKRASS
jgi:hypothetical protein